MNNYQVSRKLVFFLCSLTLYFSESVFPQQSGIEEFQYLSPVPGSGMNSPGTNIIVRFGTPFQVDKVPAGNLLEVEGQVSEAHSGKIVFAEENRTLLFYPDEPFSEGEMVTVKLNSSLRDVNNKLLPLLSYDFRITKKNLNKTILAEPNNFISKIIKSEMELQPGTKFYSQIGQALIDSLPEDFPSITVSVNDNAAPGGIFFTPFIYPGFKGTYLIITDNFGVPVFYRKAGSINYDFKMQPSGVLSYFENGFFYVLDGFCNVIDSIQMKNGYATDIHEFLLLQNGHSLMMSYDLQYIGMDTVVVGGQPNARVTGLVIQELDQNKDVVFQWRSWDHFQITDATYDIDLTDSIIDYVHGNAIEVDYDGNLLISSRHLDEITKIDRQTGSIIWRLGGEHCRNNQFTFINDPIGFSHQHDIRRLSNGNITLFDNGNLHNPMFSRSVEYQIDEVNKYVQLIADYRHVPLSSSWAMGSSRRLANHNTLIGWGTYLATALSEVTIGGSLALSLSLPDSMLNYRAFKYPWRQGLFTSNPESLDFGYVQLGDSLELSVEITNNSGEQIEINSVYNRLSCYRVKTSLPVILPPQISQEITIIFKPDYAQDCFDELHLRWQTVGQRIAQVIRLIGTADPNSAVGESELGLTDLSLSQNYPNPFNPSTKIRYKIPERSYVSIKVFDILGNEVAALVNEEKIAGSYEVEFSAKGGSASGGNASSLASGIYFYQLKSGSFIQTKKMILLK